MARLLLVEDDPDAAEMVAFVLSGQGHEVERASDARTALRAFETLRPEAVILDVMLPDRSGIDVCAAIRAASSVPILFVTARGMLRDKVRGFGAGGDDYLVKPFLPTELVMRVDALLRRSAWSDGGSAPRVSPMAVGDLEIDPNTGIVRRGLDTVPLSSSERRVVQALASSVGRPLSPEQITRHLGVAVGSRAEARDLIYMKICRLRRKLEPDPARPIYVRNVRGLGYVLRMPER